MSSSTKSEHVSSCKVQLQTNDKSPSIQAEAKAVQQQAEVKAVQHKWSQSRPATSRGQSRPVSKRIKAVQQQVEVKAVQQQVDKAVRQQVAGPSRPATSGSESSSSQAVEAKVDAAPARRGGRPPARGINQGRRRYRPANPVPKVQMPLPEKITFYESLSVAELAQKLRDANHLRLH